MPIDPTRYGGEFTGQSNRIGPAFALSDGCDECGCSPNAPRGCGCSNEDCPCSESEED